MRHKPDGSCIKILGYQLKTKWEEYYKNYANQNGNHNSMFGHIHMFVNVLFVKYMLGFLRKNIHK